MHQVYGRAVCPAMPRAPCRTRDRRSPSPRPGGCATQVHQLQDVAGDVGQYSWARRSPRNTGSNLIAYRSITSLACPVPGIPQSLGEAFRHAVAARPRVLVRVDGQHLHRVLPSAAAPGFHIRARLVPGAGGQSPGGGEVSRAGRAHRSWRGGQPRLVPATVRTASLLAMAAATASRGTRRGPPVRLAPDLARPHPAGGFRRVMRGRPGTGLRRAGRG